MTFVPEPPSKSCVLPDRGARGIEKMAKESTNAILVASAFLRVKV